MLVKKSTEHHVSAVRSSVTSGTVSQIGSETQTQGDLKEPKEKDFCVQVEMLPRPVMVDAGVQTDPEPSPPCYGMKGSKVDTQHDHTYPRCQKVRRKIIKRKKVSISEPDHTKEELVGANPPTIQHQSRRLLYVMMSKILMLPRKKVSSVLNWTIMNLTTHMMPVSIVQICLMPVMRRKPQTKVFPTHPKRENLLCLRAPWTSLLQRSNAQSVESPKAI